MNQSLQWWPEREIEYLYSFGWVLVVALIVLLILSYYKRRKLEKQTLWTMLLQDGLKHSLNATEQKLLSTFYQNLNRKERKQMLTDRRVFRNSLYSFLEKIKDSLHKDKVEMLDRLFSFAEFKTELHTLEDLRRGEIASVMIQDKHRLAVVAKEAEHPVLYVRGMQRGSIKLPSKSSLFLYRQKRGAYTVPVIINAIGKDSVRIEPDGPVQFDPDQDMIAEVRIRVNIQKWPVFEGEAEETVSRYLHGEIRKVSMRAFSVDLETDSVSLYERGHETWLLNMAEPPGLELRGDFFPVPGAKSRFYFKPHDLNSDQTEKLHELLSENSPAFEEMV